MCDTCNVLEDEHHVIFICPNYHVIRVKFMHLLSVNNSIESILNPRREFIVDIAKLLYEIQNVKNMI